MRKEKLDSYAKSAINWCEERVTLIEENNVQIAYQKKMSELFVKNMKLTKEQSKLLIKSFNDYVKELRSGKYGEQYKNLKLPKLKENK